MCGRQTQSLLNKAGPFVCMVWQMYIWMKTRKMTVYLPNLNLRTKSATIPCSELQRIITHDILHHTSTPLQHQLAYTESSSSVATLRNSVLHTIVIQTRHLRVSLRVSFQNGTNRHHSLSYGRSGRCVSANNWLTD